MKRWKPASLLKADFFYRALPWTALLLQEQRMISDLNLRASNRISAALTWLMLGFLMACFWKPGLVFIATLLALSLVWLNAGLHSFFAQKRGLWFSAKAVIWHWYSPIPCSTIRASPR